MIKFDKILTDFQKNASGKYLSAFFVLTKRPVVLF